MPLLTIIVITVLAHAAFNGSRVTISLYALSLGASPLSVGMLLSLYAALPMVLAVSAGRMVDRRGVRVPLIASAVTLAAMVALPGLWPGMAALYIAAAGIGTAFMVIHIAVQHVVGDMSTPEERQGNFGWLALGFSISNVIGPSLAGVAIDTVGHTHTFLILAALALASLAIMASNRGRLSRHAPHAGGDVAAASTLELLANPELRRIFLVTALLASAWDLFSFAMPIHGTAIGLSATTIGLVLASFALATFVIRLILPWLGRHVREWAMITATCLVSGTAYALFPAMDTVALLSLNAFLLGLGLGATQPAILSLTFAKTPRGRAAEALGVRSMVMNASHTFLPLAFGVAGAALGMAPVFWTMAAFLAGGGWFANRHRRRSS
jgi:predicted MFS family arabinose efflux permease